MKDIRDEAPVTQKVLILGAGMSGICAAVKLRSAGIKNFRILEKADRIGGTWRDNRYPGVACDVPSHLYSFSFEPNPQWSRAFAPGAEILAYMDRCVRRRRLDAQIDFGRDVQSISRDGKAWLVVCKGGERYRAQHVISGMGGLHVPNIPAIAAGASSSVRVMHTAQWDTDFDFAGQRVALIGTGASAVQCGPEIAKQAANLTVFQRSPTWVLPKRDPSYSLAKRIAFALVPGLAKWHRYRLWRGYEAFGQDVVRDTPRNISLQGWAERTIRESVPDPAIARQLTPDYRFGCKRPTLSNRYYRMFARPNVALVTSPVDAIEGDHVISGQQRHGPFDAIILATGFKPFNISRDVEIVGPKGTTLAQAWTPHIRSYRSVMVPGFPNLFMLLGPNSGGLTSALQMIEAQADYAVHAIRWLDSRKLSQLMPTDEAAEAWTAHVQSGIAETFMNDGCQSWWTDPSGYNHTTYPFSSSQFRADLKFRPEELLAE